MAQIRTHYDNLKVARDAPPEVIRAAYKTLSQRYHPDRNPGNPEAGQIMAIINASYEVLSDPDKRRGHDLWIAQQEQAYAQATKTDNQSHQERRQAPTEQAPRRRQTAPPPLSKSSAGKVIGIVALFAWIWAAYQPITPPAGPKPDLSHPESARRQYEEPNSAPVHAISPSQVGASSSAETLSPPRTTTLPTWNDIHTWALSRKFNADELEAARNLFFDERIKPLLGPDELAAGRELFDTETKPGFFERVGDSLGISERARAVNDALAPEPRAPYKDWESDRFDGLFELAEKDHRLVERGLSPGTLRRMAQTQSQLNPMAVGNNGARGLMNLTPATAERYGVKDPHDPVESINAAARHMGDLLELFHGDAYSAVAAYSVGEGTVKSYLTGKPLRGGDKIINPEAKITPHGIPPWREAQENVRRILTPKDGRFKPKQQAGNSNSDAKIAANNWADIFDAAWHAEIEPSEQAKHPDAFQARLAVKPYVQGTETAPLKRQVENQALEVRLPPKTSEIVNPLAEWEKQSEETGQALQQNRSYVRPSKAPNGQPWPVSAGYVAGYKRLHGNGLSSVTVDNSRNDSDFFVKLVSLDGPQAYPVRQFYIPALGAFTLNKVSAGRYDIRYRDLGTGGLSRSEAFNLENTQTYGGVQYSNITMTLYTVQNGNMQTYALSEAEF